MDCLIKGITVTLYEKVQSGVDGFNAPVYTEMPVSVENVLVSPTDSDEILSDMQMHGKRAEYELSIPKGDSHNWEDSRVDFFGMSWRTFGFPRIYIDEHVPLNWNKKVKVERYG